MAQYDPETYGWFVASVLALIGALKMAISKISSNKSDPLASTLKHDVEKLDRDMEVLKQSMSDVLGDLKVIKFKLDLD